MVVPSADENHIVILSEGRSPQSKNPEGLNLTHTTRTFLPLNSK
jgi:hypothetical protein